MTKLTKEIYKAVAEIQDLELHVSRECVASFNLPTILGAMREVPNMFEVTGESSIHSLLLYIYGDLI